MKLLQHTGSEEFWTRPLPSRHATFAALARFLAVAAPLACASAATTDWQAESRVYGLWPPPPAQARIEYVRSVREPRDLGVSPSFWRRAANALTGVGKNAQFFVTPAAVAFDEADNLCVTDSAAGSVVFVDLKRKRLQRWDQVGSIKFVSPVGIAKRKDTFYVADSGLGQVVTFSLKGKPGFVLTNHLARPCGVAVLRDVLFVVDARLHQVLRFDLRGSYLGSFGKRGVGSGEFNFPTHIASDGKDRICVTDSLNSRVQVFDRQGAFQAALGGAGDTTGRFGRPKGVALDSFGHVYVVDAQFDNFQIFDPAGTFLLSVGETGSDPGMFWLPVGISISSRNLIYVADSQNHRLQVFRYIGQTP